ncbi:hypothetical protein GCM10010191_44790 [Actinomadura vinacea]|uniref:Uncharacterized protein n=1 Tax=Actinomadura vinacea TaxID=115336 RepID=A0ABN3JF38_9ACTN
MLRGAPFRHWTATFSGEECEHFCTSPTDSVADLGQNVGPPYGIARPRNFAGSGRRSARFIAGIHCPIDTILQAEIMTTFREAEIDPCTPTLDDGAT